MNAVEEALYNALSSANLGEATGVFNTLAPQGQAYPFVVFTFVLGQTDASAGADGLRLQYDVKAVDDDPSPRVAGAIADAIDAALHFGTLSITGWNCVEVRRVGRIKYHDGECWHVGATYEILIQEV